MPQRLRSVTPPKAAPRWAEQQPCSREASAPAREAHTPRRGVAALALATANPCGPRRGSSEMECHFGASASSQGVHPPASSSRPSSTSGAAWSRCERGDLREPMPPMIRRHTVELPGAVGRSAADDVAAAVAAPAAAAGPKTPRSCTPDFGARSAVAVGDEERLFREKQAQARKEATETGWASDAASSSSAAVGSARAHAEKAGADKVDAPAVRRRARSPPLSDASTSCSCGGDAGSEGSDASFKASCGLAATTLPQAELAKALQRCNSHRAPSAAGGQPAASGSASLSGTSGHLTASGQGQGQGMPKEMQAGHSVDRDRGRASSLGTGGQRSASQQGSGSTPRSRARRASMSVVDISSRGREAHKQEELADSGAELDEPPLYLGRLRNRVQHVAADFIA